MDQILTVKTAFFEVWLIWVSNMVDSAAGTLTFSTGTTFTRNQLTVVYGPLLVQLMFEFTAHIASLKLTDEQKALYCAVLLLTQGLCVFLIPQFLVIDAI